MSTLLRQTVVVATFLVACKGNSSAPPAQGSATTPGSAATPPADAAAAVPGAKVFEGPTFSVSSTLSGPETKQRDIDTDAGKTTMTMYVFTDPTDGNTAQMVETNPIPVKNVDHTKVLESAVVGMTGDLKALVHEQKFVTVAGKTMLDFTALITDADGVFSVRGRVAFEGGTLYQVLAMGSGPKPSASADLFITSFQVK